MCLKANSSFYHWIIHCATQESRLRDFKFYSLVSWILIFHNLNNLIKYGYEISAISEIFETWVVYIVKNEYVK